jgi:16S rRNA (guanine527-N7)-methyltransferase
MDQITKYFNGLTDVQLSQYEQLFNLYSEWNSRVNVISRKDIDNLYHNHVLHSLSIAKYAEFNSGDYILDAGTGGGFPGVPLAIMFPQVEFLLVDSIGKKLKVIENIASDLNLANVKVKHSRLEDLNDNFDFVVSRAVTRLDVMWNWVNLYIKENRNRTTHSGLIYLKGGDIESETPNNSIIQKIDLNELFNDSIYDNKALVHIEK